jgi:hypothetical protein
MLTDLEYTFLCACQEAVLRQQELVPMLAHSLDVEPNEVFYHWVKPPRPHREQRGKIANTDWKYYFHGYECDLKNAQDGRFLRIDFGPHGRFDTFSGWGVLQFVMTTKSPWRVFPDLQAFLAEKSPPYNELSGSHQKMTQLASRMVELNLVEAADSELCKLIEEHTYIEPNGWHVVKLPAPYNDWTRPEFWDSAVCKKWVFSDLGKRVIAGGVQVLAQHRGLTFACAE